MYVIEQDAVAAMEALQARNEAKARDLQLAATADKTTVTDADTTFSANMTTATGVSSNKSGIPAKKKAGKPKMTAKEKKERGVGVLFGFSLWQLFILLPQIEIERIIACLPLEFRGSDAVCRHLSLLFLSLTGLKQTLRRNMETVIEGLMAASAQGLKCTFFLFVRVADVWTSYPVHDLIKPPDLNQARVNKCLIALVNRKVVQKESSTVGHEFFKRKASPCPHHHFS